MRVEFTPFAFTDLLDLELQSTHQYLLNPILGRMLSLKPQMEGPYSWSGWTAHGRLVACAGILPNGVAWALFSGDMRREFVPITRMARKMMERFPGQVIADIDAEFPEAVRWAKLVGFEPDIRQSGAWRFRKPEGTAPRAAIS